MFLGQFQNEQLNNKILNQSFYGIYKLNLIVNVKKDNFIIIIIQK